MPKTSGVYKITNIVTNQIYIGSSTICIYARFKYHLKDLRNNKHHSNKLQNSFNKYKEENFKFEVLEECSNVLEREQFFIDLLNPFFNICKTAGNCSGRVFSEESKLKMSESAKKRGLNPSLLKSQQKKYTTNLRVCKICNLSGDLSLFKNNIKCKRCFNKLRPSRSIPGAKTAHIEKKSIPIIATNGVETFEFNSFRECERQLSTIYPKINKFNIKKAINNKTEYYGLKWRFKNA